jgi:hypothetical protein
MAVAGASSRAVAASEADVLQTPGFSRVRAGAGLVPMSRHLSSGSSTSPVRFQQAATAADGNAQG